MKNLKPYAHNTIIYDVTYSSLYLLHGVEMVTLDLSVGQGAYPPVLGWTVAVEITCVMLKRL